MWHPGMAPPSICKCSREIPARRRDIDVGEPSDPRSDGQLPTKFTLFESAKLAGVDPHGYVLEATRRAIASPGAATLPENVTRPKN